MSDEVPPASLPEEASAKIRTIVEEIVRSHLATIPLSLTPMDPLLHEEALARLRNVIQASPAGQVEASIGPSTAVDLAGKAVLRISAKGTLSVTPQLIDPEASKRFWDSPTGWAILTLIAMILIFFYQEYRLDIRDAEGQKLMREIVKQVEEFWLVHKEQAQPTPTPILNEIGD